MTTRVRKQKLLEKVRALKQVTALADQPAVLCQDWVPPPDPPSSAVESTMVRSPRRVGCMRDNPADRAMLPAAPNRIGYTACLARAKQVDAKYFAVGDGGMCYLSNHDSNPSLYGPATDCTTDASGRLIGGPSSTFVYQR